MNKKTGLFSLLVLVATLPACLGDGCSPCKKQEAPAQEVVIETEEIAPLSTTDDMAALGQEIAPTADAEVAAQVTAPDKI